jgi:thiamine biosynthesis protein ThiC
MLAGHVPLNKIPENMEKQLEWCNEVRSQPEPAAD